MLVPTRKMQQVGIRPVRTHAYTASTLKRYREAISETFTCIHVPRSLIKSRTNGKGQRIYFALLRFVSFRFGLLRVFCWGAICDQGFHCDAPFLARADN